MTRLERGLPADREYDLLVVGGGISGAAVACGASARVLSVALVHKSDIGGATSVATGKLIHGGLRYLKNFEIGLVRESLTSLGTSGSAPPPNARTRIESKRAPS